ncbi:MAG: aspartate/glutamate racemase family protein [Gordonia sp. (in: high G+C Gram-positive bacteria)]|uniref:aspartate/glutamate racemase family protein n=1 Tax=Gordonia sp. (in: high G+C Gram-positive bacteria) TaxID=84139 RepID=UPI0039E50BCD
MSDSPHVLVINPNTNTQTTDTMTSLATQQLAGSGLTAVGATAAEGPSVIVDPTALAASVPQVVAAAKKSVNSATRGIMVAAIGDPGVDDLRKIYDIPIIGIGGAAVLAAGADGEPFGMVTTTKELGPSLEALVKANQTAPFTGLRFTSATAEEVAADPKLAITTLSAAIDECVKDGAKSVIIGGGPLSAAADELAKTSTVGIVQPVPSAAAYLVKAINQ